MERPVDLLRPRLINFSPEPISEFTPEETRFPWDFNSKPHIVNQVLCGYKDYFVNVNLVHLVSSRLLEGYALRSVNLSQKPGRSDKGEVILAMAWLPHVTIYVNSIMCTFYYSFLHLVPDQSIIFVQ